MSYDYGAASSRGFEGGRRAVSTVFRMVASCDRLERKHVFDERENKTQVSVLRDIAKVALRCRFCDLYEEHPNFKGMCRAMRVQYAPVKVGK